MTTADIITTVIEFTVLALIVIGFIFEPQVAAFENKVANKIKRALKKGR